MRSNKAIYCVFAIMVFLFLPNKTYSKQKDSLSVSQKTDTIPCSIDYLNAYPYRYLQITSSDKTIASKLNYFFLHLSLESTNNISDLPINKDYSSMPFEVMLSEVIDSLGIVCKQNELTQLVDHNFTINYNSNNIFSVRHEWNIYNYATTFNSNYTINLMTMAFLELDSIFSIKNQYKLLELIKKEVAKTVEEEIILNKYYPEFIDFFEEYSFEYNFHHMNDFILVLNQSSVGGIRFLFSYDYPWGAKGYEPGFDLFFTFDELKPYLKKYFKEQIELTE
ncbi:hypothetical protein [Saccharicrinis aurantiacus]|uniref:hypothetical protein n=1 Tax=Saccharicrinis aurantiacus TaxID=1849719 RepID=UPI0024917442|nr:hypothetical protein [Saccharicrinis aurantiacus]